MVSEDIEELDEQGNKKKNGSSEMVSLLPKQKVTNPQDDPLRYRAPSEEEDAYESKNNSAYRSNSMSGNTTGAGAGAGAGVSNSSNNNSSSSSSSNNPNHNQEDTNKWNDRRKNARHCRRCF